GPGLLAGLFPTGPLAGLPAAGAALLLALPARLAAAGARLLLRASALVAGAARTAPPAGRSHLELPVVELPQVDQPARRSFGQEAAELAEAVLALVEPRIQLDHDLLQPVRAHHVVLRGHLIQRALDQHPGIDRLPVGVGGLPQPGEARVAVVLVAVLDQDVRARLLDPHADH